MNKREQNIKSVTDLAVNNNIEADVFLELTEHMTWEYMFELMVEKYGEEEVTEEMDNFNLKLETGC